MDFAKCSANLSTKNPISVMSVSPICNLMLGLQTCSLRPMLLLKIFRVSLIFSVIKKTYFHCLKSYGQCIFWLQTLTTLKRFFLQQKIEIFPFFNNLYNIRDIQVDSLEKKLRRRFIKNNILIHRYQENCSNAV